jgi:hypothetical protein
MQFGLLDMLVSQTVELLWGVSPEIAKYNSSVGHTVE